MLRTEVALEEKKVLLNREMESTRKHRETNGHGTFLGSSITVWLEEYRFHEKKYW